MKNIEQTIRDRLKQAMSHKGLSQMDLARQAGLPHQSVYKIIHGKRVPTIAMLDKLASSMGLNVADLVQRDERLTMAASKEETFELFRAAVKLQSQQSAFEGLTKATPAGLIDIVQKFGGWNFLYEFLCEELDIRKEAERDYQKLKESLRADLSPKEISVTKNKMIVSKMIAKSRSAT